MPSDNWLTLTEACRLLQTYRSHAAVVLHSAQVPVVTDVRDRPLYDRRAVERLAAERAARRKTPRDHPTLAEV